MGKNYRLNVRFRLLLHFQLPSLCRIEQRYYELWHYPLQQHRKKLWHHRKSNIYHNSTSYPRFGGGERPPFSCKPIAPLTITMGQRLIFRRVAVPRPIPRDPPHPPTPSPGRGRRFISTRKDNTHV